MSYVTVSELEAYASARGITLEGDRDVLLTKAMDYLDLQNFRGTPIDDEQEHHFPVFNSGTPKQIKQAQMAIAVLFDQGQDPLAPVGQRVLSESVVGAVSVTYSDGGSQVTRYPHIDKLLRPWLAGMGGSQFRVSRG